MLPARVQGALFEGCAKGDLGLAEQALRAGADGTYAYGNHDNQCSLHIACAGGHLELVRTLLSRKYGLERCLHSRDVRDRTPLMCACDGKEKNHAGLVHWLLRRRGGPGPLNGVDSNGQSALMLALKCGNAAVARTLLKRSRMEVLSVRDKNGKVALDLAQGPGLEDIYATISGEWLVMMLLLL